MTDAALSPAPLHSPRFSGHESFACRYAWLPKAYRALDAEPTTFGNDETAMLELGIGKNMVKSLRFWLDVMGIVEPSSTKAAAKSLKLSDFAHRIFARDGLDPYLEDVRTHWLLHWKLSSKNKAPLFAWDFLINQWPLPEFSRSEALSAFARESRRIEGNHSDATLSQHLDVFLHTYLPSRNATAGVEDSLDGPLVDLNLLLTVGERRNEAGRFEPVYSFRREQKPEITPSLFDYCLMDFWARFTDEETISLRNVALGDGSPGQVFKLTEDDVRARLEDAGNRDYVRPYTYQPSAVQGLLTRVASAPPLTLNSVYGRKTSDA